MFPMFFGVPQFVVRSGLWAQMRPTEQSLYICLLHDSERCSTRELLRTDAQICKLAGLSSRSLCNARKKLQERGLCLCIRNSGNRYTYTLCNPETQQPWLGDPKKRIQYLKKAEQQELARQQDMSPAASQPTVTTHTAVPFDTSLPSRPLESYGVPRIFD